MKDVKKITGILCGLFILGCGFASAFDNGFFIGVEPIYTLQNGTLNEYVIAHDNGTDQNVTMSRLDWNLKNISYLGGRINTGWNFISLTADFSGAFPKESGTMEDYDWLDYNTRLAPYTYNNPDICTTKSISENTLNQANQFNLKLQFDVNPFFDLLVSPFIGFKYSYYNFAGRNGYGWYGQTPYSSDGKNHSYEDPEARIIEAGDLFGIDYERHTYDVNIGTSIGYILFNRISFGASISVSPYMNIQSIDFHHSNKDGTAGNYYYDVMNGYFNKFDFGAYVEGIIIAGLSADVSFNYSLQSDTPGITYQSKTNKFKKSDKADTTSASAGNFWQLTAGIKYTF